MSYNFDEIVNREGTASVKYDLRKQIFGADDIIPLWVADMDFKTPDFIIDALKDRLDHEVLGYSIKPPGFDQTIINWMQKRHGWKISEDWIDISPGVVPALAAAVLAFSQPGEEIIVQTPVYFPFFHAIKGNSRVQIDNPLVLRNNRYEMDLQDLRKKISSKTRMIFLCNPHNPGGSVWKYDELRELSEICLRNNILIISDEIHSDLILYNNKHIPMASLSPEVAGITITMMSSSKTFNTAGLAMSIIIASNNKLRKRLGIKMEAFHLNLGNIPGYISMQAGYESGEDWLEALLAYLEGNINYIASFLKEKLPEVKMIKPEGTYLVWLDFRSLDLSDEELNKLLINKAKLGFSKGKIFSEEGKGFQRFNIACPRSVIKEVMERLDRTFGQPTE